MCWRPDTVAPVEDSIPSAAIAIAMASAGRLEFDCNAVVRAVGGCKEASPRTGHETIHRVLAGDTPKTSVEKRGCHQIGGRKMTSLVDRVMELG